MSEHEWLDDVTPIGVSQDSLAIQNMWMGKRIAETMRYDLSNPRDIVSWLASVTDFHDKYVESQGTCVLDYDSLQPLVVDPNILVHWKNIRETVINAVRQFPVKSVLDVLDKIDVSLADFMVAMTTNKFGRYISREQFISFENDMLEKGAIMSKIVVKHGIIRNLVIAFRDLYEPMVIRLHGQGNDMTLMRKEFHDLIRAGTNPKEIVAFIKEKYDISYTLGAVRNYRKVHGLN
ncbi:hypothetical protein UFOVP928_45 [uncultured Caudovirales phage]|uniref:Uncharacterized protein n=1 Tax=uncultured Caudovirales phage TaxID=2100421 RepID=A0A6J5PS77_9CAUD|nr:hypothetical protein UFOVP578_16 [uncultured Caudovirales phage]CAB4172095.1 hypothetical protein UFOVP928_45 [uncultured Caudovirales phage]CAB4184009.1 hypothetical protein UFOVP1098_26 [uncultured Caudovirales phage]CAB4199835.1 hypothetical protein UFOVP1353_7 [uncultured Caudovirales phage]CAB4214163.1 hypothetical protein UFOVP1458_19 [uncultured Caudovirales phage]